MKSITGTDLAKALERHEWMLLRVRGSHHIYGRQQSNVRLSVPIHGSKPLKIGLLAHLLKSAGLKENDI